MGLRNRLMQHVWLVVVAAVGAGCGASPSGGGSGTADGFGVLPGDDTGNSVDAGGNGGADASGDGAQAETASSDAAAGDTAAAGDAATGDAATAEAGTTDDTVTGGGDSAANDPCAGQADGQLCDDGDPCTDADACKGGVCAGAGKDCEDGNPCTIDACDAGTCAHQAMAVGATCDDGSACTAADACDGASCVGTIITCDDGDPCTADSCDAATGCVASPTDGPCSDGDACTEGDLCVAGSCVAGQAKVCTADGPCQVAACDSQSGQCKVTLMDDGAACDDGKPCTAPDTCLVGSCIGTPKVCDDGESCTEDACAEGTGACVSVPLADGSACDDGSLCTEGDGCASGTCTGTKLSCDDGNPCTEDLCEAAAGCFGLPKSGPCDDDDACSLADACTEGTCKGTGTKDCDDNNPCTTDGCDGKTGACTHDAAVLAGKACDDGSKCTSEDACKDGACVGGKSLDCADSQPCTADGCDAGTGICTHAALAAGESCSDGSFCTLGDTCDAFGICTGKPIPCDDGKVCTIDGCDAATGACTFKAMPKGASCDDGDACTLADSCDGSGSCNSGKSKDCDDGNACTSEVCDNKTGDCKVTMLTTPCDDGNACTLGDRCTDGSCKAQSDGDVGTLAGSSAGFLDGAAASARFNSPRAVTAEKDGSLVVADYANHRIRRIAAGKVTNLAGNGSSGYVDGAANTARFSYPSDVTLSGSTVYVADRSNHRVRSIAGGQVATAFGQSAGIAEGKGSAALLNSPEGISVGGDGALWVADTGNHAIRRVDEQGILRVLAGGGAGFADGKANAAKFNAPRGIAADHLGVLYVADSGNHRIRRVLPDGTVTTVAGNQSAGYVDAAGAAARFNAPYGIAVSPGGVLYVADANNRRIRRIDGDKVSTWSGSGTSGFLDGAATTARFASPQGVAWVPGGSLAVADYSNHRIRGVASSTVDCDDGLVCTLDGCDNKLGCQHAAEKVGTVCNDGNKCTSGEACAEGGACVGKALGCGDGNPCTVDACNPLSGTCSNTASSSACEDGDLCLGPDVCQGGICKPAPMLTTWVGSNAGFQDGKGTGAMLNAPSGLDEAGDGTVYLADRNNHRIRVILPDGTVSVFAGSGTATFKDGPANAAAFYYPADVAMLPDGSLVVADRSNRRIRSVQNGQVTTLAGSGSSGFLDGPAAQARFYYPEGIAVHPATSAVYVADSYNNRIRRIEGGNVTTFAGSGSTSPVDGVGTKAGFYRPWGLDFALDGTLIVADTYNHRIRAISSNGTVTTIAGSTSGFLDGKGTAARFYYPADISIDPSGTVFVADRSNHRIRRVYGDGQVDTYIGTGTAGSTDGPLTTATINNPYAVLSTSSGLIVADTSGAKLRTLQPGGTQKNCDDLDVCTTDACDAGTGSCTHTPIANCCQPVKQHWKFGDEAEIQGWTLAKCAASTSYTNPTNCATYAATSPYKGWQIWTTAIQQNQSAGALYYGDPSTKNFNFGASAGTATSPAWTVPAQGSKLEFSIYWDCESSTTYDKLYTFLYVDGKKTSTIFYKGQSGYTTAKKWYKVAVDVSAHVGKSVQLQVYFNSGDSIANTGQGVFVDDVKVSAPCN